VNNYGSPTGFYLIEKQVIFGYVKSFYSPKVNSSKKAQARAKSEFDRNEKLNI
jgi:hypothetical protein